MFKRFIVLIFIVINLASCSTSSNALYHNEFDFSAVETYGIYNRNSEFTNTQSLADTRRNSIEIAIEKHMEQRNFHFKDPEHADIIVTYHFVKKSKDYKRYNKTVLFCQQCIKASNWKQGEDKFKVEKDSLIIDLIDPARQRSVWRSIQPLKIKDKDNSHEVNEKIYKAVNDMLVQYPQQ